MPTQDTQQLTRPTQVITPPPDTDQPTTETQPDQPRSGTPDAEQPSGPRRGRRAAIVFALVAFVAAIVVAVVVDFGGTQTTGAVETDDEVLRRLVQQGDIPEQALSPQSPTRDTPLTTEQLATIDLVSRGLIPAEALVPATDVSGSDVHLHNLAPATDVTGSDVHLHNLAPATDVTGSDVHLHNLAPTTQLTEPVPVTTNTAEAAAIQAEKQIVAAGREGVSDPFAGLPHDDAATLQGEKEQAFDRSDQETVDVPSQAEEAAALAREKILIG